MKSFRDTFAERLTTMMGGMTQEEFARVLGICRPTLAFYLTRKRVPSAETLHQICERTGCTSDWLLGLADGRWKKISPAGIWECSMCGQNVMTKDIEEYKYCHGCGRRMKWW